MNSMIHRALELSWGSKIVSVERPEDLPSLNVDDFSSPPLLVCSAQARVTKKLKSHGYTHFLPLIAVPSRSAPRWVFPVASPAAMVSAADIYQPHKAVPRLGKQLFTTMMGLGLEPFVGSRLLLASMGPSPLEVMVREVTGESRPLFAFSFGRERAVRKLTIQVLRQSGEILGYLKLPLTERANQRVRHEASVLQNLVRFPGLSRHVPQLLYAGPWSDSYILFQTPLSGEPGPTTLTGLHDIFFTQLRQAWGVERGGFSLVEEVGSKWQHAVQSLDSQWAALGHEVLRRTAQELTGQMLPCGIGHGDFAPWNTRTANGRLLVFDWESARWNTPHSWDLYHFRLQTTVSSLTRGQDLPSPDGGGSYMLYLLNSVVQFVQEENTIAIEHRRQLLFEELKKPISAKSGLAGEASSVVHVRRRKAFSRELGSGNSISRIPTIVTTSWDDGDPRDTRIAELLRTRNLKGTFYIPISGYLKQPVLPPGDIRDLSDAGFEIGAHSVSHESLTRFRDKSKIEYEVKACKQMLEDLTGKEVSMFCYPNGRYNLQVIKQVQASGYKGARTTRMLSTTPHFNPFEMPTTLQAFRHPRSGYLRDLGRARNVPGLWKFTTELGSLTKWRDIGRSLFQRALEEGGIWHLYGHSWEIDEFGLWSELNDMLDHVAQRDDVLYLTNSELLSLMAQ